MHSDCTTAGEAKEPEDPSLVVVVPTYSESKYRAWVLLHPAVTLARWNYGYLGRIPLHGSLWSALIR